MQRGYICTNQYRQQIRFFAHGLGFLEHCVFPNLDAVTRVQDWQRAAHFPEGGKSVHGMCHQWEGWETCLTDFSVVRLSTL